MKRKSVRAVLPCLAVVAVLALAAAPAGAIIGGQQDSDNAYSNVGIINIVYTTPDGDYWDLDGTCTLVRNDPGNVIVVTAAHCVGWVVGEGGPGVESMRVSFDPLLTYEPGSGPVPGAYRITRAEMHPDYVAALATTPYLGNAKRFGIGPGREDVALLWLDTDPIAGIDPAPIAGQGYLDTLHLKSAGFTVVGYGINGFVTGSYMSWRNPNVAVTWSGRNFRDVSVVSQHDAFGDRYLKVTQCTAFGDSGGPTFHDGNVVAVTVWGGSMRCLGPAYQYRLDTELAHSFLDPYLYLP